MRLASCACQGGLRQNEWASQLLKGRTTETACMCCWLSVRGTTAVSGRVPLGCAGAVQRGALHGGAAAGGQGAHLPRGADEHAEKGAFTRELLRLLPLDSLHARIATEYAGYCSHAHSPHPCHKLGSHPAVQQALGLPGSATCKEQKLWGMQS